ncbi:hypothetical protein [Bradyrhizobium sp. 33ap4]|uniref:hypothetical protein n=1 Tax=Bradyrhizobium sp. 33ap4 TaxID=3061630 RepID=UPI00292DAD7B|nr:hypothetical protein [Bradyrhizobium sp. 33ap4]
MIYLVVFTAASLLLLHLLLRAHFGSPTSIWIWVEYIWCVLSFVALFLANIQIKDKTDAIQADLYKSQIEKMWDNVVETGKVILGDLTPEVKAALLKEHPSIDSSGLASISRLKRSEEKIPPYDDLRHFYWRRGPLLFCKAMFGEEMSVTEQRSIISTFKFSMSPSEHFWIEAAQECADAKELTDKSTYVFQYERQRADLQPAYSLSFYWSFFLAFGLALKLTKTTSDYVALRRKKIVQEQPVATVSAPQ